MHQSYLKKISGLAFAGVAFFAVHHTAMADSVVVSTKGGLSVYDKEDFWFKVSGRMQFDQVFFDGSSISKTGFPSGSNLRRAQLALKGGFHNDFSYKLSNDFTNDNSTIKEAFVAYHGVKNSTFALGNISVPFGLENTESSAALTFLESAAVVSAFAPSYGLGFYGDHVADYWTVSGAIYHPGSGQPSGGSAVGPDAEGEFSSGGTTSSDATGMSVRVTASPVHDEYEVWHFGASALRQDIDQAGASIGFATGPGAFARTTPSSLQTPAMTNIDGYTIMAAEMAYRQGPWNAQGEVQRAKIDGYFSGGNPEFTGYYAQASYVVTGEVKAYDKASGTFDNPKPRLPCGAWEIAGRYGFLNLNNKAVRGGAEHDINIGVNWYLNNNLKFMGDYTRANISGNASTANLGERKLDIFGFRAQVAW